jgi:hypothetical protein
MVQERAAVVMAASTAWAERLPLRRSLSLPLIRNYLMKPGGQISGRLGFHGCRTPGETRTGAVAPQHGDGSGGASLLLGAIEGGSRSSSAAIPAKTPRLKPERNSYLPEPLGLKAELLRMNAGAPTIPSYPTDGSR